MIGLILFLIALVLMLLFSTTTFVISFIYYLFAMELGVWCTSMATVLDILGNVMCGQVFNVMFRKKGGYDFGNETETISYVLGMNAKFKTLTRAGKILVFILNKIDKNHCGKAINT